MDILQKIRNAITYYYYKYKRSRRINPINKIKQRYSTIDYN